MSNFLLHKHCKPDEQFKRPEGLTELLCDITREVLREQPDCVYTFCADYLDAMLLTREQTFVAERTRNSIFAIAMTISDLMREIGIPNELASRSADIIEQSFQLSIVNDQHDDVRLQQAPSTAVLESDILEKLRTMCGFSGEQLQQVQRIIQACFKDYYFREKEFTLKMNRLPYDHWANQVEKTLELYRHSGPQRHELERAAVAIQAAYRSYYSRKLQRELLVQGRMATTIQANYRGHLTRRRLAQAKEDELASKTVVAAPSKTARAAVPIRVPVSSGVDVQDSFITAQIEKICRFVTRRADDGGEPNLDQMATTIQASYRGHLVRKQLQAGKQPSEPAVQMGQLDVSEMGEVEEVIHIDESFYPDVVEDFNAEEEQEPVVIVANTDADAVPDAGVVDVEQTITHDVEVVIVNSDTGKQINEPEPEQDNPIPVVEEAANIEPDVIAEVQPDEVVEVVNVEVHPDEVVEVVNVEVQPDEVVEVVNVEGVEEE